MFLSSKTIAFSALSVALVGCNQVVMPQMLSTGSIHAAPKHAAFQHTLQDKRPVQEAFVELPLHAGPVLEVVQARYHNGTTQRVVYGGDLAVHGENHVTVQMLTPSSAVTQERASLSIDRISDRSIARELRKNLPGVAMRVSSTVHTNAYGTYGFALGRGGKNVRCIYGWQNLEGNRSSRWAWIKGASSKPRLSVRMRICREGVGSERLQALMQNMRIHADPSRLLSGSTVAWRTGSTAEALTGNGYVSEPRVVVSEPVRPAAKPVTRTVKRSKPRRKTVRRVVRRAAPKAPAIRHAVDNRVYNPPLPGGTNVLLNKSPQTLRPGAVPAPLGPKRVPSKPAIPVVVATATKPVPQTVGGTATQPRLPFSKLLARAREHGSTTVQTQNNSPIRSVKSDTYAAVPLPN